MSAEEFGLYGHTAGKGPAKNKAVYALTESGVSGGNHWSSSENNSNNAVNVNLDSGNLNNNNKNNSNNVRAVSECNQILFDNIDVTSIYDAYEDCRKHKTSTKEYLRFQMNKDRLLYELWEDIVYGRYKPVESTCFVVTKPVPREIFAANFRDRIVHHWICMRINPWFEALFEYLGNVSHNCRVGYGTSSAVKSLQSHILECSDNFQRECWVGKFDFKGFFMSIDKTLLWNTLEHFVKTVYHEEDLECLLYLLKITVDNQPQNNCIRNSPEEMWDMIPKGKSLFTNDPNYGLPIGNLTSQLLANFFLSYFDWYITCILGFQYYVRYVDDFVIVDNDKQRILDAVPLIRHFLATELHITLHPDKQYIQRAERGIKFVGSQLKYNRKYVANRTRGRFYQCIAKYNRIAKKGQCLDYLEDFRASMNSYLGFFKDGNNYATKRKGIARLHKDWYEYVYFAEGFDKVVIKNRYLLKNRLLNERTKQQHES